MYGIALTIHENGRGTPLPGIRSKTSDKNLGTTSAAFRFFFEQTLCSFVANSSLSKPTVTALTAQFHSDCYPSDPQRALAFFAGRSTLRQPPRCL